MIVQDKIKDVVDYEYTKKGGYITLKFNSGWVTRRKFINITFDGKKRCDLSGNIVPAGQLGVYISIKKRGYSRYNLSQTYLNKLLSNEQIPDEGSDIQKSLINYLNELKIERNKIVKEETEITEAVKLLKFNKSKISKKMSAVHRLLELVTE